MRVKFGSQNKVVLAGVTHAYCCIQVPEAPFDQFIEMNSSEIIVTEQRVLSEHCLEAQGLGSHQYDVLQNTDTLMSMHNINSLPDKYLPN